MRGRETGKPPFDLSDLSLSHIELGGCWRRLDIGARVCAGAALALGHENAMVLNAKRRQ